MENNKNAEKATFVIGRVTQDIFPFPPISDTNPLAGFDPRMVMPASTLRREDCQKEILVIRQKGCEERGGHLPRSKPSDLTP